MKIKTLPIYLYAGLLVLSTGCLGDENLTPSGSSSSGSAYEETVPAESAVNKQVFDVLNLDYSGLEAVKTAVAAQEWGKAALELQKYYRNRADVTNPNVDLLTTSISTLEQSYADYALKENGYRFYVKGFFDTAVGATVPYSYLTAAGGINWTYVPTGDQEQRYQVHRHQWFIPQAKAYKVTGNAKYLKSWMSVYDDWWTQNPKPAYCHEGDDNTAIAGWIPLSVATRVLDQCDLLEYYKWADDFTPAYLTHFLWRMSEQVEFIKSNYWETSNQRISQAQAVTVAGVLFPEMKNASTWVTNGSTTLNEEIVKQYYNDGWLKDNDLHYHIASIESFRYAMLVASVNNEASRFNADYVSAIRKMVEVEKYLIYPNYGTYNATDTNYSVPNFGDTRSSSWTRNVLLRHMRNYANLFPDDAELKWLASQGKEGTAPAAGIKCFTDGGHYALRSAWTKDATMMVLVNAQVSPAEQWHRQWDNNNFELYVNGRQFFPDSGCYTYGGTTSSNADRKLYAATKAHTTLTLDDANVTSCRGVCLKSETTTDYDLLVLQNPSYTGLTHRRAVFFVGRKFFVIVDEGYGTAAGVVNLHFHLTPGSDTEVVVDADQNGAHTAFTDKNNLLVRTFSSVAMTTTALTGFVSIKENVTADRKSYRIDQTKTADQAAARFITVLYPAQDATAQSVSAEFTDSGFSTSGAAVRVVAGGKTYNLAYTL